MNTAVYLLRCFQLGMSIADLDEISVGMATDILTEAGNDSYDGYKPLAEQKDFDAFNRL